MMEKNQLFVLKSFNFIFQQCVCVCACTYACLCQSNQCFMSVYSTVVLDKPLFVCLCPGEISSALSLLSLLSSSTLFCDHAYIYAFFTPCHYIFNTVILGYYSLN